MDITIAQVKRWREEIDATHLVVFAIGRDGRQHVATHGETEVNSRDAAEAGNTLKMALRWPEDSYRAKPLARLCKNCAFYKPDYGTWCFNGWTGDGSHGHCMFHASRARVRTTAEDKCGDFEPADYPLTAPCR